MGCHLWGRTELDTTEATQQQRALRGYVFRNVVGFDVPSVQCS